MTPHGALWTVRLAHWQVGQGASRTVVTFDLERLPEDSELATIMASLRVAHRMVDEHRFGW